MSAVDEHARPARYHEDEVVSMMTMSRKRTLGFVAIALVAVMMVPNLALAAPARSGSQTTVTGNGAAQLEQRVMNALRNRAQRYDNYEAMLQRQQERLMELCEKVEAAGGDCTQVREQIQLSVQTMEQARVQEQTAIQAFKGVVDAEDKRGAFGQARNQARESVRTMKQSRDQLHTAARLLQGQVEDVLDDLAETESE